MLENQKHIRRVGIIVNIGASIFGIYALVTIIKLMVSV
jgi:hypothetical protein